MKAVLVIASLILGAGMVFAHPNPFIGGLACGGCCLGAVAIYRGMSSWSFWEF